MKQAAKFTHKATTPAAKDQWAAVANAVLGSTGSDARAIRTANGVIKRNGQRNKPKP